MIPLDIVWYITSYCKRITTIKNLLSTCSSWYSLKDKFDLNFKSSMVAYSSQLRTLEFRNHPKDDLKAFNTLLINHEDILYTCSNLRKLPPNIKRIVITVNKSFDYTSYLIPKVDHISIINNSGEKIRVFLGTRDARSYTCPGIIISSVLESLYCKGPIVINHIDTQVKKIVTNCFKMSQIRYGVDSVVACKLTSTGVFNYDVTINQSLRILIIDNLKLFRLLIKSGKLRTVVLNDTSYIPVNSYYQVYDLYVPLGNHFRMSKIIGFDPSLVFKKITEEFDLVSFNNGMKLFSNVIQ